MDSTSLLLRLRERKLFHWGITYLAGAWLLLQVASLVGDHFEWPPAALRTLTVVLAVGFPAVLILAWYHGDRGEQRASAVELLMLFSLLVIAGSTVAFVSGDPVGPPQAGWPSAGDNAAAEEGSIAVLPFVNMSSDAENAYFSDGLTEELINALVKVDGLRVPARTSVFAYRDKDLDVREIGRQLGVAAVLEGSVRKAGETLRITAQLIDVATGYHLWSETYERELSDIFAIQNEIAESIVRALGGELPSIHAAGIVRASTGSPEAYSIYLQARYYWNNRGVGHADFFRLACDHYSRAVAADSSFAAAWGGLADCSYLGYGGVAGSMERTRAAARRALELDPTLSGPHSALGQTYVNDGDWQRAEREHRAAIALDPHDALAFQRFALMLTWMGRHEEALDMIRRAERIDPASLVVHRDIAGILFNARRHDEALEASRRARELNPGFAGSVAEIHVAMGMHQEAAAELVRRRGDGINLAYELAFSTYAHGAAGRYEEARVTLRALEALARERGDMRPIHLALAYLGIGDVDRAFAYLEEQHEELPFTFANYQIRPYWDPIRDDPRWGRLLQRVGLDPRTR